jgi:hypothetical protein
MIISLVRIKSGQEFRHYIKLDDKYITDPRFIYKYLKEADERFSHIREVISKFGEIDYQISSSVNVDEEVEIKSIEVSKGDNLTVNSKVPGRFLASR